MNRIQHYFNVLTLAQRCNGPSFWAFSFIQDGHKKPNMSRLQLSFLYHPFQQFCHHSHSVPVFPILSSSFKRPNIKSRGWQRGIEAKAKGKEAIPRQKPDLFIFICLFWRSSLLSLPFSLFFVCLFSF